MGVIYSISFIGASRRYIGSAHDMPKRLRSHLHLLRRGLHHSIILQRAADKYGLANLVVSILETVEERPRLIEREQFWIDHFSGHLYNRAPCAASRLGIRESDEARRNKSSRLKGNKHRLGILHDAATRLKIGEGVRRANAEGRRKIPSGNAAHFARFLDDIRTGRRQHPKVLPPERVIEVLTALYRTRSLERTSRILGISRSAAWDAAKQFRGRLDDAVEAATGRRPFAKYRSTAIHPDWFEMAL